MPKLHPGQNQVRCDSSRFKVLACGRRWGKTRLGAAMCVEQGIKGNRAWWVAPSYKMSVVGWRLIKRLSVQIPHAESRETDKVIQYFSSGEVRVRSADDPDSLRGEGLDFLVLDECAFIKEDAWREVLRPALSDRQGDAVFISTPHGKNWFWRLYLNGEQGEDSYNSWRFPTSGNPFINPDEIDRARSELPDSVFRQEYLAEFLDNEGQVFRNLDACLVAPESKPEEHDGHYVVAGVDWGKHQDFTAISVGCADCQSELWLDRFNQIDYTFQRGRLRAAYERWHALNINAESNAMGEPIIEQLVADGMPVRGFQTTASTKPQLINNLALALERAEWQFLPDSVARGELEAYEQKVSPTTGRSTYSAPEGLHDDTVIARALMLWAAHNRSWLVSWDD